MLISHTTTEIVPLLAFEQSMTLMEESGVTSITFFAGSIDHAAIYIRQRFAQIVQANPWLNGKLVKDNQSKLFLHYDELPDSVDPCPLTDPSIQISDQMDYGTLVKKVGAAIVKKGRQLVDTDEPLTRLTLVPDANHPTEKFALILSISHIIADGFTYYQILNSLSSSARVVSLDPLRKPAGDAMATVVGRMQSKFLTSIPLTLNVLKGMAFQKKARCYAYFVDEDRIRQAKEAVESVAGFVSTNDILMAGFSNAVGARLSMMAINLRNRVGDVNDSDAGNYESGLFYDREHYEKPEQIRESLNSGLPMKTTSRPMPGFFETLFSKFAQVSNWSSFSEGLVFNGATQVMHLPVYNLNMMPFDCAIIFQPVPNRTAVLFFTKTLDKADLIKHCAVNEPVDSHLFE